jgi:DNA-binding NarL/FixJ family response regulator
VGWTIRKVERRVSSQRRRGMDNRLAERDGSGTRRHSHVDRRAALNAHTDARIRVLVIEDNRLMRDGLVRLLSSYADIEVVAAVEGATAGVEHVRDNAPNVVLLDSALTNGDSHKFLANLHSIAPLAKAVIMDLVPAQPDVTQFIEAGANGFIMKDASADDFVKAIRTVDQGGTLPLPALAQVDAPASTDSRAPVPAAAVRLTKREQEIKDLIAAGLGNKEIAQRLNIATNTVKSHVHNMLGKLATLTPPDRRLRNRGKGRRGTSRRSYRFAR